MVDWAQVGTQAITAAVATGGVTFAVAAGMIGRQATGASRVKSRKRIRKQISNILSEVQTYIHRSQMAAEEELEGSACCLAFELPLATLNVKDYEDFVEYEGLQLLAPEPDMY